MKKTLITLSVISMIAIVILVIYLVIKNKNNAGSSILGDSTTIGESSSEFPLRYSLFTKSTKVVELQAKLNKKLEKCVEPNYPKDNSGVYIKSLKEDGYFGDKTLAVVKYFCDGNEEVTEEMFNTL